MAQLLCLLVALQLGLMQYQRIGCPTGLQGVVLVSIYA